MVVFIKYILFRLQANGFHIAGNATLGMTSDGYLLLKTLLVDFDIEETEVSQLSTWWHDLMI